MVLLIDNLTKVSHWRDIRLSVVNYIFIFIVLQFCVLYSSTLQLIIQGTSSLEGSSRKKEGGNMQSFKRDLYSFSCIVVVDGGWCFHAVCFSFYDIYSQQSTSFYYNATYFLHQRPNTKWMSSNWLSLGTDLKPWNKLAETSEENES